MRPVLCLLLLAVAASCDDVGPSSAPLTPDTSRPPLGSPTPPSSVPERLRLSGDTSAVFVGGRLQLSLEAFDASGISTDATGAELTSSNPDVANLARTRVISMRDAGGRTTIVLYLDFALSAPGRTTLRARLGGVTDSLVLSVQPLPPLGEALVVDSFTVVEYRATCAWECPYLAYAPLLRLREPTGKDHAYAVGVEVKVSGATIGPCSGAMRFAPGVSEHLNHIDPYLWSTALLLVRVDGVPLPGDSAHARVIVRDARGTLSRIEVRGPILRTSRTPVLPVDAANIEYWTC